MKRSCLDLGVCQGRRPACADCERPFAPGVIDGPHSARHGWPHRELALLLGKALGVLFLLAVALIALGWLP